MGRILSLAMLVQAGAPTNPGAGSSVKTWSRDTHSALKFSNLRQVQAARGQVGIDHLLSTGLSTMAVNKGHAYTRAFYKVEDQCLTRQRADRWHSGSWRKSSTALRRAWDCRHAGTREHDFDVHRCAPPGCCASRRATGRWPASRPFGRPSLTPDSQAGTVGIHTLGSVACGEGGLPVRPTLPRRTCRQGLRAWRGKRLRPAAVSEP